MLVKICSLFFLLSLPFFAQASFQSELEMLQKSSSDISVNKWDKVAPQQQTSEDSISLKSSGLKKKKAENLIPLIEDNTQIKKIRKRSR
jgi:hypothetical protein